MNEVAAAAFARARSGPRITRLRLAPPDRPELGITIDETTLGLPDLILD